MFVIFSFKVKLAVTSVAFAFNDSEVFISAIFAFNAIEVFTSTVFALVFNAVCVAVLMGFNKSVVLSTFANPILILSIANAVFNAAILATPVPPFSTGTIPAIFSASTVFANCA